MQRAMSKLPEWTEANGGRTAWRKWVDRKVATCVRRAADWATKRHRPVDDLPSPSQWREAILAALAGSQGRGHYSQLQLSLASPRKSTHWNWPSIDHVRSPGVAEVVLETRLVNDMKTIMSEDEFCALVGHLATVMRVDIRKLSAGWSCSRSFAVEEQPDE